MSETRVEINGETLDTGWELGEHGWRNTSPIQGPLMLSEGDQVTIILPDGTRHEGVLNLPTGSTLMHSEMYLKLTFTSDSEPS